MNATELKDLLANATPGPWSVVTTDGPDCRNEGFDILGSCISGMTWIEPDGCEVTAKANARLIALAPQLAADNIALQAEVERLRARHPNPADHRYWEGRYRDEKAENAKLREASENLLIAIGMGWDLDGVIEQMKTALNGTQESE